MMAVRTMTTKLLLLSLLPSIAFSASLPYATCDGCFCVPGNDPCPVERMPETNFTELVALFKSIEHTNPFTYDKNCNPHDNSTCTTEPPQELRGEEGAVCAFRYEYDESIEDSCPVSYSHESVASKEEAEAQGLVVTHYGACGVCSSAQDLAIFMDNPDLTAEGTECGIAYILKGFDSAVECYQNVGFSLPCAILWTYDSANTQKKCSDTCITKPSRPNNGDPPSCPLDVCLECNEIENGPVFAGLGGRTRRNSGLLSMIVRPCSQLLELSHPDPCPQTENPSMAPSGMPTAAPTAAPTASAAFRSRKSFGYMGMFFWVLFGLAR